MYPVSGGLAVFAGWALLGRADAPLVEPDLEFAPEQERNYPAAEQKQEFEAANLGWRRISWSGSSKEWGPATVGFAFTDAGNGKVLTVTYWVTKKDQEKHFPTIEKIFESVKRIGS